MQPGQDDPDNHIVLHDKRDGGALDPALAEAFDLIALDKRADEAAEAAVPSNTRRAYELELHCFASWCTRHGVKASPAEPRV
ncbi:MAG TPA: hypothetical protein VKT18_02705, partial [Acidimicrobiales bacterium]|nr:hypothetical protein [Acidimicrobiales bacterium]